MSTQERFCPLCVRTKPRRRTDTHRVCGACRVGLRLDFYRVKHTVRRFVRGVLVEVIRAT